MITKALADRRALINEIVFLFCQNEILRFMLSDHALSPAAEDIFIMMYRYHLCLRKAGQNFLCSRMIPNRFFHINMRKPSVITILF